MRAAAVAIACALAAGLGLTAASLAAPRALDLRAADRAPTSHGPAPRGHAFDVAQTNADCEGCHEDVAAEWRSSLHRASHTDPSYRRQFAREPLPFCQGCHAPEADAMGTPTDAQSEIGTACVTCHVAGETVLAATTSSPRPDAPHALTRTEDLTGARACAPCHEFPFPNAGDQRAPLLMQSTVTEHAASGAGACADCHMPIVDGARGKHRSHAFAASRDDAIVKNSVAVSATRDGSRVVLRLEAKGIGHAFPTGDLFRRIEVFAEVMGDDMQSLGSASTYLARHFAWGQGREGERVKILVRDDRLQPGAGPTEVALDLGHAAAEHAIVWRVAYQRVDLPDEVDEERAVLDGEIVLGTGTLP